MGFKEKTTMKRTNLFISILLLFIPTLLLAAENSDLDQVRTVALPGTVALTFDDGPDPAYTPRVLETLKKYNIKATFFVIGELAKQHPDLVKRIIAEGHAVANHTWSHPKLNHLNDQQLAMQVTSTQDAVVAAINLKPVCLRPPYGMANQRVKDYIRSQGIIPVGLGFNSFDYERRGVEKLTNWVISNARSGQVILMHDGNNSGGQTMAALPQIIEGIQKRGLGFSAICYPPKFAEAQAKILAASSTSTTTAKEEAKQEFEER
jgi:peptidoglycan-N-acetylglucosamine deacetylase